MHFFPQSGLKSPQISCQLIAGVWNVNFKINDPGGNLGILQGALKKPGSAHSINVSIPADLKEGTYSLQCLIYMFM